MLGSKVESTPDGEWELAHNEIKLSETGKKLFWTDDNKIWLHQMHQDHVVNAPSWKTTDLLKKDTQVHVWGSSRHTEVQGVYISDRLFTSQGHLGFDEDMVIRQIDMRIEGGGIEDGKQAEKAKETAELQHDGEVVASAILRLFHGEDAEIK